MGDFQIYSVLRFKDGTSIGLKDFFLGYFAELSIFANRYVSDLAVCEDIVQEAFISLWQKRRGFQNLLAAKGFLYTTVRNACLDYLKHVKVQEKYLQSKSGVDYLSESFIEEIIKAEAYSQVRQEIDKLPQMGRKVLLLSMRDKTNEEIANLLNVSINTIRTHKARAYKVLRKNLKDFFLYYILSKISPSLK